MILIHEGIDDLCVSWVCSYREGLVWDDINWMDNGECLDLIEKVSHDRGSDGRAVRELGYKSVGSIPGRAK